MRALILFLVCFHVPFFVLGGKEFRLGRSKGGNLGAPGADDVNELPPARWFKQKLDHSNPSDLRTWQQRYFVNSSFFDFKNPGPVFLMVGGEGPADPRWMVKGTWIEYAKKFKALCINLEHRYYGESHPTPDLSVKNLKYLSSSQALADIANFIDALSEQYKFNHEVKWVAFGGSYPGSLAAWLRLKFPHLVHAAVSSSGPLLAKVNFMEYFQVVVDALREKTGNDNCVEQLKLAHEQIEIMLKLHPEIVEKEFKVCKPFKGASINDMKTFFNALADNFADLVQYNEDNRLSADEKYKNVTINSVCRMLTGSVRIPALKKLAEFNTIMLQKSNQTCLDYSYNNMIMDLRKIALKGEGARQWMYQTCTEFGFYQTSSSTTEVFGNHFDLDYFVQQCKDVFGNKYDERFIAEAAEWTNSKYGALDISVSRVVFVHGSVDPWHALGLTKTADNDAPVIYIKGTAHCANMYPAGPNDSSELRAARVEVQEYLGTWLEFA